MLKLIVYTVSRKFPNVDNISTAELEQKLQSTSENQPKILIIDSRKEEEFSVSRLEKAKHFHFLASDQELKKFIQDNTEENSTSTDIICYCSLGYRSSVLADRINKLELDKVKAYNLEGSIFKWANENRPLQGAQGVHPFSYLWGILGLSLFKWQWTPDQ
eukprot:TRINITY_DN11421_c0_g1_i1.p2 TRINITY_DN11421_c0_g1~~TRINITY_DN11421_c0_g1_i1.p2  ORF type:complete len:173 (-),score=35.08 TRINITY_DN11421_c0_g1_i1:1378-1857(-)